MIRLTRVRTAPPVHDNFHGPKRVDANLKLLKLKRDGKLQEGTEKNWNSDFWKKAKDQLLAETHNKCAYCETPTKVVDYGDVEHFRPKSKYWWLAYCYDNYLASCAICNQKFKSDGFYLRDDSKKLAGPAIRSNHSDNKLEQLAATITPDPVDSTLGVNYLDFENELKEEGALLVHPYFDDPEEYYAYKPILETQEVHIVPAKPKYKDVVKASNELFGINRTELLDLRFQWYCIYMTYRHTLADTGINANTRLMNQNRINEMLNGHLAYTGMVRYFQKQNLNDLPWRFDIIASSELARRQ